MKIPDVGLSREALFDRLAAYKSHDLNPRGGRTWAYVYDPGRDDIEGIAKDAFFSSLTENALDPTVFPSLVKFETEVVAMAAHHLGGDHEVVGHFTSGGTESCMMAVKAARDMARATRSLAGEPELVLPTTAHAAFHKAAHYFGLKVVSVPVDPATFLADPAAMEAAITPNTVLMVASAVSYAHGVVDPIRALGEITLRHQIPLHVDGCIGGFILPYLRRLGESFPDFDFSVPGVTSISMDFHKYAYCPKGASVILYRNKALRRFQLFAIAGWTGYTIVNTTFQSTKSGGPLAATWAVLNYVGDAGYLELARLTLEATRQLVEGISRIPHLRVLGRPDSTLIAFTSDTVNVFHIIDEMKVRGWYVQPQLSYPGSPANIHLSVTATSLGRVEGLLQDLAEVVEIARHLPVSPMVEVIRGALASLEGQVIDEGMVAQLMAAVGISGGALPERMAEINQILDALPPVLREQLLLNFVGDLFSPPAQTQG